MIEKKEEVVSFSGMETALVKEAIHHVTHLYTEEVMRQMLSVNGPVEKVRAYAGEAFSFATTISPYLIGSVATVTKIWNELRGASAIFEAVMRTTVKLRGMYSSDDWELLVKRQAAGISIFTLKATAADETVLNHLDGADGNFAETILTGNPWLVTLLLLNYLPMAALPASVQEVLRGSMNKPQTQDVQ